METTRRESGWRRVTARLRWLHLAPVLAMLVLSAWAVASPVGAAPDDDFHLVSIWCANGGSDACSEGDSEATRTVSRAFHNAVCYARKQAVSAECQEGRLDLDGPTYVTDRGNFHGQYPAVYYGVMRAFAGDDLERSVVVMRLFNAALFVGLATALAALLGTSRRRTLVWGWLVSVVPLGLFLIPSNNPSGWAITGVGTAFLAALGWFESHGRRRWALGALYAVAVLMAAGARGDSALYVIGASLVAAILSFARTRDWLLRATLPAGGTVVAFLLFLTARQADAGVHGFSGGGGGVATDVAEPTGGLALAAYNLLMLPDLWTGVWGTWGLGWLDTPTPAIVPWAAVGAFVAVGFAGLGLLGKRKSVAVAGVVLVLVVLPVYVLTVGGDTVGEQVQPRYFLPVIVLLALVLAAAPESGRSLRFTRVQTLTIVGALALAQAVALQANLRRYVTGTDQQGLNLDSGAEWWWHGFAVGPLAVWLVGSSAFAGLMAVLWPVLARASTGPGGSISAPRDV